MGKGSNTTSTTQQQTYNPAGAGQIQGALTQAQNAAQLPFNIPQAPVAGFSQDQRTAFGNINNAQGMAQPYINQAQQYFSPQGAQQFLNPYAANVMAGMKDVFGQQASQNTGQLTQAAGGVGADRIAVGQSELARQQDLSAGQTLAGLYGQSVQQAQSAGYGTAALGSQAQNAALSGAQAQLASGGLQQQLQQAQMNSPYQQQLAQAAFPYQQAQFLAGITGSLAPGLGGTTSGTGTNTGPSPSMLSQILGLGTAAAGAAGGAGAFGGSGTSKGASYGGGGPFSGDAYGGSSSNPLPGLSPSDYGGGYAGGGAIGFDEGGAAETSPFNLPPGFNDKPINVAEHSIIPTVQTPAIRPEVPHLNLTPPAAGANTSGSDTAKAVGDVAKLAMMFINRGGRVPNNPYAEGGSVKDQSRYGDDPTALISPDKVNQFEAHYLLGPPRTANTPGYRSETSSARQPNPGPSRRKSLEGYAAGGTPSPLDTAQWPYGPEGGPSALDNANWPSGPVGGPSDVINPDEPYRMPDAAAIADWRQGADASMADGTGATSVGFKPAFPPPSGAHGRSLGAPAVETPEDAPQDVSARSRTPAAPAEAASARDTGFAGSPWAALMAAGLGIAGGTSPFPMVNIGKGGLQGLKTLEDQRAASQKDETIDQATRRLDLEAKHHEDQFTRMTPYQQIEALKPVQVGQDDYGRPIMAKRNPKSGEYEIIKPPVVPAPTAPGESPTQPGSPLASPAATTVAATGDTVLPTNAKATEGLLPGGTLASDMATTASPTPSADVNPDALAGLKPADANKVRMIAEGRAKFLPLTRNNAYNRYIMDKVSEYNPNVDEGAFSRRSRTQNFFAVGTAGGGGQNIAAMNTFGQHADELLRLSKELNLGRFTSWNEVKNWMTSHGYGDKEIQNKLGDWQVASKAVADEGAKVFAGTNSALADREQWQGMFDASNPASVTQSKLKQVVKLIEGRLNSLAGQYNDGMRTGHTPAEFIRPRTREIFDRINKEGSGAPAAPTAAAGAPAAAPSAATAAPQVGERRQFKQGWGVWNGKSWEAAQ